MNDMHSATGAGTVLLVDDNDSVRIVLEAGLEDLFQVRSAANAIEARKALATTTFDVIVTDFDMPGESGADLLDHVEKLSPTTVGILITGHPDHERVRALVKKSIDTGRVLVLYKPVAMEDIVSWVKNGVAMARLARMKNKPR